VVEKVATVQKWLEDQIGRQVEEPTNVDPVLTSTETGKKRDVVRDSKFADKSHIDRK
jgi:hypothetical protein